MGLKLQNTLKRRRERASAQNITAAFQSVMKISCLAIRALTWQTNWADVTDFNEVTMAEACSSVVHMHRRRQHQLWTLLRIGQEHPLFRKHKSSTLNNRYYIINPIMSATCKSLTRRYCARAIFCGIFRYNPPVISQAWKTNSWR